MPGSEPTQEELAKFSKFPDSIIGPKTLTFTFESKTDPRWNFSGRGNGIVSRGKDGCPEAVAKVKELEDQFGEIPDDLTYSYWKD